MDTKKPNFKSYLSQDLGESSFHHPIMLRINPTLRNTKAREEDQETDESELETDMEMEETMRALNDAELDDVGDDLDRIEDMDDYEGLEASFGDRVEDFEDEVDDSFEVEPDDPDRQGLIRTVDNAHLIYKRKSEDGTFHELWIYNVGANFGPDTPTPFADEMEVRDDILASTDIDSDKMTSEDGSQSYTLTTMGNAQYMHVKGLPN